MTQLEWVWFFAVMAVLCLGSCAKNAKSSAMLNDFTPTFARPTERTLKITRQVDSIVKGWTAKGKNGRFITHLLQRPCMFEQSEPGRRFDAHSKTACTRINSETRSERGQTVLKLPSGTHEFVVSSQDVPYELGFWIRDVRYPGVALAQGGGILPGVSKTYVLDLKPGRYLYACPLNPTPDYFIVVE